MGGVGSDSIDRLECRSSLLVGNEEDEATKEATPVAESLSRASLADAPILLLIRFHKALRLELADLRLITLEASESGSYTREFIKKLIRRVEFLKLAYKYHCAAEDEVVFPALNLQTKNVVRTYSLEHESIDGLFTCIFRRLDEINEENKDIAKPFQELVFCLGTMQTSICQHMVKEEEQVFPLLMQQFSPREQASLVWQFICSVPMILLQKFLPWMMSFLPSNEQPEVRNCLRDVIPNEKLQEVIMSWLGSNENPCVRSQDVRDRCLDGAADITWLSKLDSSQETSEELWNWIRADCHHKETGQNPVDSLHLWHGAIMKDLGEILKGLFQVKECSNFSNLDSILLQLKFLADVILFYRKALEKFFDPIFNQLSNVCHISSEKWFLRDSHIEGLQRLLQYGVQDIPLSNFLEKLSWDVESFIVRVSKQFTFQETMVLPAIRKSCSHKKQQQLLYMSLHTLPLGLLKCIITWFSSRLSEDELKSILHIMPKGDLCANDAVVSLLREWFRTGYLGKTSIEQFGKDLKKIFQSRSYFLHEQMTDADGTSSLSSNIQSYNKSDLEQMGLLSANKENGLFHASGYETSYSSGINLQIHFPGTMKKFCPYTKFLCEEPPSSVLCESKPINLIIFFHKALKKELDYFVHGSAQLAENVGDLTEFIRRFQLVRFLYQIHTDAEDQIAFPSLETKGQFQNISRSYTIDHKLNVCHFSKISFLLDEMSNLHASILYVNTDWKLYRHQRLCLELHDLCKSLHKILSDHVDREEIEVWPLFTEFFSVEEQEKVIGAILGRTKAEILQDMIPWQMTYLAPEEQHELMSLFRQATRHTMFNEWLREWWEDYDHETVVTELQPINPSLTSDPLEIISKYLSKEAVDVCEGNTFGKTINSRQHDCLGPAMEKTKSNTDEETKDFDSNQHNETCSECKKLESNSADKITEFTDVTDNVNEIKQLKEGKEMSQPEHLLTISQEDLEAVIRRISKESSLDSKTKSYLIQNLLVSRWTATRQVSQSETIVATDGQGFVGQNPSYRDSLKKTFGCKHYKRNCKLLAPCCNQLFTCIHCHDEATDHTLDRKTISKMMCMNCLAVQPIGKTCSSVSCGNLSMGKYFCKICKLFDDSRDIYHCPYCNLCRVGKGLGIDYFHCMNCNACMYRALSVHVCREKCLEDNCPICHEYIFTSTLPVKSLPCGHLMHSACFQEYTNTHYTCPICSKSLGDMQVYFEMLDALLAEEKIPDEYSTKTQVILCNDCEKRGSAPFHWLYHKCSWCGSYNTRVL